MKLFIAIAFAAAVSIGGTAVIITGMKNAEANVQKSELEKQFDTERQKLERQIREAKKLSGRSTIIIDGDSTETPVLGAKDPQELLDLLLAIPTGPDKRQQRRAIHFFESLADIGPKSLPPIGEFLSKNVDKEYGFERGPGQPRGDAAAGATGERRPPGGGGPGAGQMGMFRSVTEAFMPMPKPDFMSPPSMRMGLFDVVRQIGGAEAESMLVSAMRQTARGIEIAMLDIILEEMAPGKYQTEILVAVRELLSKPAESTGSQMDDRSRNYLFAILAKYKDETFLKTAQTMLVTADGHVDGLTLNYLNSTLGEKAMPIIYDLYKNTTLTNMTDQMAIRGMALRYIGSSANADEIFRDTIQKSKESPEIIRDFALMGTISSLIRGPQDSQSATGEGLTDASIRQRQQLLASVKSDVTSERMTPLVEAVEKRLGDMLDPEKRKEPFAFNPFGGGAGGGGGFRFNLGGPGGPPPRP
ncbi:MAG: hypothetical protein EXS24_01665 [Pedosphaera sp.]|nr:hypothetical protein [Pedosphaera sp.]